jgi:hypothetical protein
MTIRDAIFLAMPKRVKSDWCNRAQRAHIGVFGYGPVDYLPQAKPLGRLGLYVMGPLIEMEKDRRRGAMKEACREVLGEDPDDWGG